MTYEGSADDDDPLTLTGAVDLLGVVVSLQQVDSLQVLASTA